MLWDVLRTALPKLLSAAALILLLILACISGSLGAFALSALSSGCRFSSTALIRAVQSPKRYNSNQKGVCSFHRTQPTLQGPRAN